MVRGRRLVVGVMGSGGAAHDDLAGPLGRLIAAKGLDLLTGGGGGVMTSVSRAFVETAGRRGICMGVLPGVPEGSAWHREDSAAASGAGGGAICAPPGYPNEYVELVVQTHLPTSGMAGQDPMSRNHINVLTSDAVVALPGGPGTCSECLLAKRYGKPLLVFLSAEHRIEGLDTGANGVEVAGNIDDVCRWLDLVFPSLSSDAAGALPRGSPE